MSQSHWKHFSSRVAVLLLAPALLLPLMAGGCDVGNEGERCNPLESHDECGGGLSCQQPADCPEAYCCPKTGTSTNPYCQPGCAGGQAAICAAGGDADCNAPDAGNPAEGGAEDGWATDASGG